MMINQNLNTKFDSLFGSNNADAKIGHVFLLPTSILFGEFGKFGKFDKFAL